MKPFLKYTAIYTDIKEGKETFFVRIVPLETSQFKFGLCLNGWSVGCEENGSFKNKEEAIIFAEKVDEYLDSWFSVMRENKIDAWMRR